MERGMADDDAILAKRGVAKVKPWPKDAVAQVRAVADVLAASTSALTVEEIAAMFTGRGAWKKRLPQLLTMLEALGRAREVAGRFSPGA